MSAGFDQSALWCPFQVLQLLVTRIKPEFARRLSPPGLFWFLHEVKIKEHALRTFRLKIFTFSLAQSNRLVFIWCKNPVVSFFFLPYLYVLLRVYFYNPPVLSKRSKFLSFKNVEFLNPGTKCGFIFCLKLKETVELNLVESADRSCSPVAFKMASCIKSGNIM